MQNSYLRNKINIKYLIDFSYLRKCIIYQQNKNKNPVCLMKILLFT